MIKVLVNSYLRAIGAMGQRRGLQNILVFVYPFDLERLFTTWFCPPLRILCFDSTGKPVYNQVIRQWCFVNLPPTRLVLEINPDEPYEAIVHDITSLGIDAWLDLHCQGRQKALAGLGGLKEPGSSIPDDPVERLLFDLILSSVKNIKEVIDVGAYKEGRLNLNVVKENFSVWQRGQILGAAMFILDMKTELPWKLPASAVSISRCIIEEEDNHAELFAASIAGVKWVGDFSKHCFRCGHPASWRRILSPYPGMPLVIQWRLSRPENHVPLCSKCVHNTVLVSNKELQISLAYAYWGLRFEALHSWFQSSRRHTLPADWNLEDYPLWPRSYGGETWAEGSGAIQHCAPREGEVFRRIEHIENLLSLIEQSNGRLGRTDRGIGLMYELLLNNSASNVIG